MTAEIGPDATNPDQGGVVTTPESGTGRLGLPGRVRVGCFRRHRGHAAPRHESRREISIASVVWYIKLYLPAVPTVRYRIHALCTNIIEYRTMVPASTTVPTVPTVPTVGTVCTVGNTKHACLWRKYACVMLGGCPKHIRQTQSKTQDFLFMPKKRLGYRTRIRLSTPSC